MPHSPTRFWIALVTLFALLPALTHAQNGVAGVAPQQPGFPAALPNTSISRHSPVVAEIVPSSPGKEIAIAGKEGILSVLSNTGQVLWQQQVPPSLCSSAPDRIQIGSPSVGTLDGNGVPYVVLGYGNIRSKGDARYCPGGVAAFDGRNGALKWRVQIDNQSPGESFSGVISTPALADVDGNGTMEVAFGSLDRNVYLVDNNGALIWRFHAADTVWASPAFANVDGDSRLDVVFGADVAANSSFGTSDGGFMYAFKTTPSAQPNRIIPFSGDPAKIENLIWRSPNYEQVMYSSPAIGDVTGDGAPDVVFGSGCFYPLGSSAKRGRWIKILSLATGAEERTIALPFCSRSSPALGDLDGDGKLDIVLAINGEASNGGDGKCRIGAWRGDGTQLWLVTATLFGGSFSDAGCDNIQAPSIADVDGNGSLEVLSTNGLGVLAFAGATGAVLNDDNPTTMGIPNTGVGTSSMPVVSDIDDNGTYEVIIGGLSSVFAWTNLAGAIASPPNPSGRPGSAPWPMFRGNSQRTGLPAADPTVQLLSSTSGATLIASSGAVTGAIPLTAAGGAAVRWTASKDVPWLSLSKSEGTTPEALIITFDPSVLKNRAGVYEGTITIASPDGGVSIPGEGAAGATQTITVRLVLADTIFPQWLPVVLR